MAAIEDPNPKSMVSLEQNLKKLLESLPPKPDKETLDRIVKKTLEDSKDISSPENRKSKWEYLLKNELFILAQKEGKALKEENTTYYDELRVKLDIVLTFTEQETCEQTFPLIVLQDLLETQTITSCSHIFSWIESRSKRLTVGMLPQKGKALILLRTLNDLLRRLSKMGSTTIFCGRILTFLSGVFPLGERSGVNLRGEYGPQWEGVKTNEVIENSEEKKEDKVEVENHDVAMQVDEKKTEESETKKENPKKDIAAKEVDKKNDEFYQTFWNLQLPFSRPPLFALPETFPKFQDAVIKVFPVIKEATAKERLLMGSRGGTNTILKRKREPETVEETAGTEYFFAKFLTSPELIELEIADTHFRRQFLLQLLILLHHLSTFTKAAKAEWATIRNRSLQIDFTLEGPAEKWVQETIVKTVEELRQTAPDGRLFVDTVNTILEREKNWVNWKNGLCQQFDKNSWSEEVDGVRFTSFEDATREERKKLREEPEAWPHKLGSAALTEIWQMGYRDLGDLYNIPPLGELKDYVKKVKQEDARIDFRKKQLERNKSLPKQQTPTPALASNSDVSSSAPPAIIVEKPSAPEPTPQPQSQPLQPNPLHPSLPAKPDSSPKKPIPLSEADRPPSAQPSKSEPTPAPSVPVGGNGPTSSPPTVDAPSPAPPVDSQIMRYEENKLRWAWLALRLEREKHLHQFGKIEMGNVLLLAQEVEKERKIREEGSNQKGEDVVMSTNIGGSAPEGESAVNGGSANEVVLGAEETDGDKVLVKDGEGDVKMEDR